MNHSDKFMAFQCCHSEQNHILSDDHFQYHLYIACEQALRLEWRAKSAAKEHISERQNTSMPACEFSK